MLTNGFVRGKTVHPLRTGVPGYYMTANIEDGNGVICDALDHEPERFGHIG